MFDEVTKQERGRRAARKGVYIAVSAAFQVLCVAAIVLVGDRLRAAATGSAPIVDVKFFRAAPSLLPPPPPPADKREVHPKPRAEVPKVSPPTAMIQPKEIPALQPPSANQPPEPQEGDDSGEGVEGGVAGGVGGGVVGGQVQSGGSGTGDAPAYPTARSRKPAAAVRDCVQNSIRIPRDLVGFVSGPVVVKFAIRQDGAPTDFRMVTAVPDKRIADAIWQAVSSCQWIPGADEQGKPTWFWITMPIRFRSG